MKGKGFLYLPAQSLVFARIPKCANTSIKTRLSTLIHTKSVQHPHQNRVLKPTNDLFWKKCTKEARWLKPDEYTALYDRVTSFSVIRDPLRRLQSCYHEKVLRPEVFPPMKRLGYDKGMTFNDFVKLTCALDVSDMDVHTQPQTFLIMDSKGRLPHFIARLENLDQDWKKLSTSMEDKGVNLGSSLPRLNSSKNTSNMTTDGFCLLADTQREYELTYGADIKLFENLSRNYTER